MRKVLKKYWGYGIVFLLLILCFEIFLKSQEIEQFDEIIDFYSSDRSFIDSVGRITSYKYTYSENDRGADSLDFKIFLYSKKYRIEINGFLVGEEGERTYDPEKFNVVVTADN